MPDLTTLQKQGADKRLFRFLRKLRRPGLSEAAALEALLARTEIPGEEDIDKGIGKSLLRERPSNLKELSSVKGIGQKRAERLLLAFSDGAAGVVSQVVTTRLSAWLNDGFESPRIATALARHGRSRKEFLEKRPDAESFIEEANAELTNELLDLAALEEPPKKKAASDDGEEYQWRAEISLGTMVSFYSSSGTVASDQELGTLRRELTEASDEHIAELAGKSPDDAAEIRESLNDVLNALAAWNRATSEIESGDGLNAARHYEEAGTHIEGYLQRRFGTSDPDQLLNEAPSESPYESARVRMIEHFELRSDVPDAESLRQIDWQLSGRDDIYGGINGLINGLYGEEQESAINIDAPLATMLFAHIPLSIGEGLTHRPTRIRRLHDNNCCCCCCCCNEQESEEGHSHECCCGQTAHGCRQCRGDNAAHRQLYSQPITSSVGSYSPSVGTVSVPTATGYLQNMLARMSPFLTWFEQAQALLTQARLLLDEADGLYKAGDYRAAVIAYGSVKDLFEKQDNLGYIRYVDMAWTQFQNQTTNVVGLDIGYSPLPPFAGSTIGPVVSDATSEQQRLANLMGLNLPGLPIDANPSRTPGMAAAIRFVLDDGTIPLASNPAAFALILEVFARLAQLDAELNWFGYRDDYLPPWRFQFLLERARYFANHARQLQSTYLSFLGSAEREEQQERSAAQNIALENNNVAVDTKRLEQSRLELFNAHQHAQAQSLHAHNASDRLNEYRSFSAHMAQLARQSINMAAASSFGVSRGLFTTTASGLMGVRPGFGLTQQGVRAQVTVNQQVISTQQQSAQREVERLNLEHAAEEAQVAASQAQNQIAVSRKAFEVAALQRNAALMRQRFAVESLSYLQNRTLSARLWHRLADELARVADSYLDRAMEMAFLAEQVYEFENNRRADVIRFDYDSSDTAEFVGADMLLRDLDSLEHELITSETDRRQSVEYVVSLARDFPEALQILRESGSCMLPLSLLPIERRFPGLHNLRIASVGLQPFALMDPTRFSVSVTHLGTSAIRIRSRSTADSANSTPPLYTSDVTSWCHSAGVDQEWPVKLRRAAVETHVYSGLSAGPETAAEAFFRNNQRGAFEGVGASAAWVIDMSMAENRVDPQTISDVVLTFRLTGYHSTKLRSSIENALQQLAPAINVETLSLSGRINFPDAFYEFQNGGSMVWDVDESWVPQGMTAGRLRNIGVRFIPSADGPEFGRIMSHHTVRLEVSDQGDLKYLSPIPKLSIDITRLEIQVSVRFDDPVDNVRWRFEDDAEWTLSDTGTQYEKSHKYGRPGTYTVTFRVQRDGRLYDYQAAVSVSDDQDLQPPLQVWPEFGDVDEGNFIRLSLSAAGNPVEPVRVDVTSEPRGHDRPGSLLAENELLIEKHRTYTLHITIIRSLTAHFGSQAELQPHLSRLLGFSVRPIILMTQRGMPQRHRQTHGRPTL